MAKLIGCCLVLMALAGVSWADDNAAAAGPEEKLTFEQSVYPILKAHCFDCHGGAGEHKGNLDLRLRRFMVKGGKSGPAIVPGKPEESYLFHRVSKGEMPPRATKLQPEQIETIGKWIAAGAPTLHDEPEQLGDGLRITPEERGFWSFQPIKRPEVPPLTPPCKGGESAAGALSQGGAGGVRTPIDAFLLAAMRDKGISFSPDADKRTLIRRASLDLTGLPPTPREVEAFLADTAPDAYDRLLDRLLASPHYGERWGRHWLDVAGYADSEGYTDRDEPRNYAYKYRDYVIRAYNADMPFDRFIQEQLAGDEMVPRPYTNLSPEAIDKLVATGYLRMAADGTGTGGIDQDLARNQVVADTIKIVSTSLMGLSLGCAQCHDHRYDPISQKDYYRIRAILEPAYDWKSWREPRERLVSLYTDADRAKAAEVEAEANKVAAEKEAKQKEYIAAALEKELEKFDEAMREPLRTAFNTSENERTDEQKKLLDENPSVKITPGVLYQYNQSAADDLTKYDAKIGEIRAGKPVEDFIRVLTEPEHHTPVTYLFHRGDPHQPEDAVAPGDLAITSPSDGPLEFPADDPALPSTGRRLAFARWLTSGKHPLVTRVLVNRVWMHHFGRGLVGTPSDFGTVGERPTHPELLDWLATEFVARGWSMKAMHKLIMTSTAYRQSSHRDPAKEAIDPDNTFYWHMPVQRLEAEAMRDSMLAASGVLNIEMFGPPVPVKEDAVGQIVVGVDKKGGANTPGEEVPLGSDAFRRSVYIQVRRSEPLAVLTAFDAPVMETNCDRRPSSTVAPQALMLMNSNFILEQAALFARRLRRDAGDDPRAQIALAWHLAYTRAPTDAEIEQSLTFLTHQSEQLNQEGAAADGKKEQATSADAQLQALTDLCQVLLSSNEFLYVD